VPILVVVVVKDPVAAMTCDATCVVPVIEVLNGSVKLGVSDKRAVTCPPLICTCAGRASIFSFAFTKLKTI
jgi:hypothetical protein